ncbi:MAG TPA: M15 family metallopeptidase [Myxococcota bacterium]|nr:M15 family metallopeptidase [Myxococcota bacterium]
MRRLYRAERSVLAGLLCVLALGGPACRPRGDLTALPRDFVSLAAVDPTIALDLRYAGSNNFTGERIDDYETAQCLLTRAAAEALARVQKDLRSERLGLLVFDCYRPQRAVDHFVRWSRTPDDAVSRARHYPRVAKHDLFAKGYIAERSGHSRGSTVDLTLVDAAGRELDLGTPFDFFDPRSAGDSLEVPEAARALRNELRAALERRGFVPYAAEWWHFMLADEPYPESYFDAPVR